MHLRLSPVSVALVGVTVPGSGCRLGRKPKPYWKGSDLGVSRGLNYPPWLAIDSTKSIWRILRLLKGLRFRVHGSGIGLSSDFRQNVLRT